MIVCSEHNLITKILQQKKFDTKYGWCQPVYKFLFKGIYTTGVIVYYKVYYLSVKDYLISIALTKMPYLFFTINLRVVLILKA